MDEKTSHFRHRRRIVDAFNNHHSRNAGTLYSLNHQTRNVAIDDLKRNWIGPHLGVLFSPDEDGILARHDAFKFELSIRVRSGATARVAHEFAINHRYPVPDLRNRLASFAVDDFASDLECGIRPAHHDVDISCFTSFSYFNDSCSSRVSN